MIRSDARFMSGGIAFFASMWPALQVAMLATKLYGLRPALSMSAILPLAPGYAVGLIDGLVERSIRRDCGARESATLYHRAKLSLAAEVFRVDEVLGRVSMKRQINSH